ncbi:hypothetical protein Bbelb_131840 [Branchiostoma belcheri]|nr:hypothetical protein Bbelb_131840 [Branchiostoma belcheri]
MAIAVSLLLPRRYLPHLVTLVFSCGRYSHDQSTGGSRGKSWRTTRAATRGARAWREDGGLEQSRAVRCLCGESEGGSGVCERRRSRFMGRGPDRCVDGHLMGRPGGGYKDMPRQQDRVAYPVARGGADALSRRRSGNMEPWADPSRQHGTWRGVVPPWSTPIKWAKVSVAMPEGICLEIKSHNSGVRRDKCWPLGSPHRRLRSGDILIRQEGGRLKPRPGARMYETHRRDGWKRACTTGLRAEDEVARRSGRAGMGLPVCGETGPQATTGAPLSRQVTDGQFMGAVQAGNDRGSLMSVGPRCYIYTTPECVSVPGDRQSAPPGLANVTVKTDVTIKLYVCFAVK